MSKTKSMILAALFAALTAVGALIRIPTPISSFTLQVLFVAMSGVLLGCKWGFLSQAAYILLGLVGLPIFVSRGARFSTICWACLLGLVPLYAIGLPYMHLILTVYLQRSQTVWATLWGGMVIFLPWDLLKVAATAALCAKLYPALHRAAPSPSL